MPNPINYSAAAIDPVSLSTTKTTGRRTTGGAAIGWGVANPYGGGVGAYEPNTTVYDGGPDVSTEAADNPSSGNTFDRLTGYDEAYSVVQAEKTKQAQAAQEAADKLATSVPTAGALAVGTSNGHLIKSVGGSGGGSIEQVINAAKTMLGKPYVWGGTTSRGVDCSGLIYYAFRAAGYDIPRYRASDYGKLGQTITADQARPGDLVYWDEKGDTDHVGIYLGGGMVIQSPQTGDVTKISKVWGGAQYKRIVADDAFSTMATPTGSQLAYQGVDITQKFLANTIAAGPSSKSTTVAKNVVGNVGRSRPI